MASVRWRKLRADLRAARGRLVVMQIAITLSLAGVGSVLGARVVLQREIAASYASSQAADATLEIPHGVDAALLAEIRARTEIATADARQTLHVRVRESADRPWQMLVLFVVEDVRSMQLATFTPETGAWPPPAGAMLLERTAPAVMGLANVSSVELLGAHGAPVVIPIAGTVHDAGQAPNWQEHRGCGYATAELLPRLGEPPLLRELLVRFRPAALSTDEVDVQATRLAEWLRSRGIEVHQIRVPRLHQHPHQGLMNAVQLVLLVFSGVLFALSAIVVATILSSILARQVREIGMMKAIGATSAQLAALYAVAIGAIGLLGAAIAVPLARAGAGGMIRGVGRMMNLAFVDRSVPLWVSGALVAAGVLVPLAAAAFPILSAVRTTVRHALADHGAGAGAVRPGMSRLPLAVRNALRRPVRLASTLLLLVFGGGVLMTAANLGLGMSRISARLDDVRRFDLELRLAEPVESARLAALAAVPGVRTVETWQFAEAALGGIVRTYPDGGHGSFALAAPPAAGSAIVAMPLSAGRWLRPSDDAGVVLGNAGARGAQVGDRVTVVVDGRASAFTVVGLVDEIGSGSAYVTPDAFARATGTTGVRLVRVATTASSAGERARILAALEAVVARERIPVEYAMPAPLMRSIIDDHLALVLRAVMVMASLLGAVGLVGLGSAMAINVAERTRELGIMKAIGASNRRILGVVLGEAAFVGALSAVLAIAVSVPLTLVAAGRISVIATPDPAISLAALIGWPLGAIAGSVLASWLPARRASRLHVRTALDQV